MSVVPQLDEMLVHSCPRLRLQDRTTFPPGEFQMIHPEVGQTKPWRGGFRYIVQMESQFRKSNPDLAQRHGWSLNREQIEDDVDAANARRMADGGYMNFIRSADKIGSKGTPALLAQAPAFVQLGRFGDLILLLPAWKAWADFSGAPVHVVSTKIFGTVLEGASYVVPTLLNTNWQTGILQAMAKANTFSPHVVVTQLHGANWRPPAPDSLSSYSLTMWKRTGFMSHYATLPLVFDKRDRHREYALVRQHVRTKRPLLLVNLDGWTSPLSTEPKRAIAGVLSRLSKQAEILDLNRAHGRRAYDQLAFMDIAAGMITSDTMPLHLAAASKMPYIALVRDDGQSGSIPKGNCRLKVGYSQITQRLPEIETALRSFL